MKPQQSFEYMHNTKIQRHTQSAYTKFIAWQYHDGRLHGGNSQDERSNTSPVLMRSLIQSSLTWFHQALNYVSSIAS